VVTPGFTLPPQTIKPSNFQTIKLLNKKAEKGHPLFRLKKLLYFC